MSCEVYANNMTIACKVADGKTIAAFPDVCLSPPSPPAGPIPIPYPNTAYAVDTVKGSKTVLIGGKEIILKDKSTFQKSTGDEAATKSLGMGVVSHQIQGEVSFVSWSMDVKAEGENVARHLDLTLHNEMCIPANTPTWPYLDQMSIALDHPCVADMKKEYSDCREFAPHKEGGPSPCPSDGISYDRAVVDTYSDRTAASKCLAARRCQLVPWKPTGKEASCCPGQTGHHLVEAASFANKRPGTKGAKLLKDVGEYDAGKAPCICAEGANQYHGTHGLLHTFQSTAARSKGTAGTLALSDGTTVDTVTTTYGEARDQGVTAAKRTFPESDCDEACLKAQLNNYHKQYNIDDDTECRQIRTGRMGPVPEAEAEQAVLDRSARVAGLRAGPPTVGPI